MAPVLQNIRHFELQSLHTLVAHDMGRGSEVGAEQRAAAELQRFFNLLDSLAWLPALDTLSVSADDDGLGPEDEDSSADVGGVASKQAADQGHFPSNGLDPGPVRGAVSLE